MRCSVSFAVGLVAVLWTASVGAEPIGVLRTVQAGASAEVPGAADSQAAGPTSFVPPAAGGVSAYAAAGGGGFPTTFTQSFGEVGIPSNSASAVSSVHSGGRFFSASNMFSGGGGGEGTPSFASLASYGGSDIEASSSLVWRGVFTASDTANHQFGFHVERMTLALEDSAGLYDMSNPLVAELSGQIRFGLGTGPLSPSDALYEFTAQLLAGGTWSDFNLINVLNPTGAQLPNFTESNFGTFHQALAPAFDAVLNLGVIPGGQSFTLEYWASTFVGSPGVVIDPNGILYGEARFGDPFNVNAPTPDQFRFQTAPVNEIPEPSTLLIFSLLGGVLTGTIIQHQRRASG